MRLVRAEAIWSIHYLACGCYFSAVASIFEALDFARRCVLMLGFGWLLSRHRSHLFVCLSAVDETAACPVHTGTRLCTAVFRLPLFSVCRDGHTLIEIGCNCLKDLKKKCMKVAIYFPSLIDGLCCSRDLAQTLVFVMVLMWRPWVMEWT